MPLEICCPGKLPPQTPPNTPLIVSVNKYTYIKRRTYGHECLKVRAIPIHWYLVDYKWILVILRKIYGLKYSYIQRI